MKKRVLVFPAGSELGAEIHRSIAGSEHFALIGLSSKADTIADVLFEENYSGFPMVHEESFIERLCEFVITHKIDVIFPAHDLVSWVLAKNILDVPCDVIVSSFSTIDLCIDKEKTYQKLRDIINVPNIYDEKDMIEYPVYLKPKVGHGGLGHKIARTRKEADYYLKENPDFICVEYLPGKEYTVDCFTDRYGKLRYCGVRERKSIFAGMSSCSIITHNDQVQEITKRINAYIKLNGAWYFQLKERKNGELVLLEIGPRVAGGMGFCRNMGVNLPLLSLYDKYQKDIDIIPNDYDIKMFRNLDCKFKINYLYEHVYVDLDGTLIIDGKVNTQIITFLYQCLNNKKKIHLITNHEKNLPVTLKKYRLEGLFDSIIWIKEQNKNKFEYIMHEPSIFIDNSCRHRYLVWKNRKIAVFDIFAIEGLLEYSK